MFFFFDSQHPIHLHLVKFQVVGRYPSPLMIPIQIESTSVEVLVETRMAN